MSRRLEVGFLLDRQWLWLRDEMEQRKRPTLLRLARTFAEAQVPYAFAAELNAAERALLDGSAPVDEPLGGQVLQTDGPPWPRGQ